jgi:hypothetical protein
MTSEKVPSNMLPECCCALEDLHELHSLSSLQDMSEPHLASTPRRREKSTLENDLALGFPFWNFPLPVVQKAEPLLGRRLPLAAH